MPSRRRSNPRQRATVFIDPQILEQMTAEAPDGLGALIEQLWRDRNNRPAPRPARRGGRESSDVPAAKLTPPPKGPAPGAARPPVFAHVWVQQDNGKDRCPRCGAWRGMPRANRPCTGG